jgi:hypothetical protein
LEMLVGILHLFRVVVFFFASFAIHLSVFTFPTNHEPPALPSTSTFRT